MAITKTIKIDGKDVLKSYYMDEYGRHWLVPANEKYDAILLTEDMDVKFVGRMVWNMQRDVRETTRNIRQAIERYLNKKGDPYNKRELEQNITYNPSGTDITSLYMDNGYLFFRSTPVEVAVDGDSIDIEIRIV